ncbi:hypothetical protein ACWQEN_004277 [Morganella morganii]|uniref:hypothetical protein n=1 Tax=Morganella morganii TaxID=582 RepID=UPI001E43D0FB|nr:hypothetical protein [Morganella morganii]EKU5842386.1 hypothetical protein [Morganella morganii]UFH67265.1 hypothetical protein KQH80_12980 [Morganella morganii]WNP31919.1 hypothetical protein RN616_06795 [Morganella morganii]
MPNGAAHHWFYNARGDIHLYMDPLGHTTRLVWDEQGDCLQLMRYLDVADIEWSFENKYCNGRELTIKTEGNVLLGCIYDKGNYWLSKIKVF